MNDSIGGAMLLNIVIFIVSILLLLLIGFLSYSKAYKVKNRIVNIVNKYEKYDTTIDASGSNAMINEINSDLASIGYSVRERSNCDNTSLGEVVPTNSSYNYCVYKNEVDSTAEVGKSYYYVIETFSTIEIPLVGNILTIPVHGETKIFGTDYSY